METSIVVIVVGIIVLTIISFCRIFSRAGEPFWKALIPGYNWYVLHNISMGTGSFWRMLAMLVLGIIAGLLNARFDNLILLVVAGVLGFIGGTGISFMPIFFLAKAFGYGDVFSVITVVLPFIGLPIIAFGANEYEGSK